MRRLFLGSILLALLATVTGAGGIVYWAQRSLPPESGEFVLPGLQSPVDVFRDENGIPYIYADNMEDAAAALGFVHAQDRLWQMDAMRRLGHGRLSEITGQTALKSDRLMRTLGISALAREQLSVVSPETRQLLSAYAAGVNNWIERHRGALPIEFALLGYEPEPWQPVDSLVWARIMAMRLSGNWRDELLRARMASKLSNEQLLTFWYPDGDQPPAGAGGLSSLLPDRLMRDAFGRLPLAAIAEASPIPLGQPRGASNAWAVNDVLSDSGWPLLANDPHLGFSLPNLWYLARIETPHATLSGATVAGVPFLVLGHNDDIAWGMTTTQSDQQDVFIERVSQDGRFVQDQNGQWQPIESRRERIRVAGQADVDITVRSTRHGPIISDLVDPLPGLTGPGYALSLSAVYLEPDDRTPDALYAINRARNWPEFLRALDTFHSPQQNVIYADRGGNIGFFAPGRVPVRSSGRGRMPSPGWTGQGDWMGWVPYDDLPLALNPLQSRIVSANNQIVSEDYPHFITDDWAPPYRASRIFELLEASLAHTVATFTAMQQDALSPMARELLPLMTSIAPSDPRAAEAVDALSRWDGVMRRTQPEPLLFYAWLIELQRAILSDDLDVLSESVGSVRPRLVARILNDDNAWCDDTRSSPIETCDQLLGDTLLAALRRVDRMSADTGRPRTWGAYHFARFANLIAGALPVIGESIGERRIPADGGNYSVNRAAMRTGDRETPFTDVHGPGLRAVYDLADLDGSRFMIAAGQSGNPFSVHYSDLLERWRDGEYLSLARSRESFVNAGRAAMRLIPESGGRRAPLRATGWLDWLARGVVALVKSLVA